MPMGSEPILSWAWFLAPVAILLAVLLVIVLAWVEAAAAARRWR